MSLGRDMVWASSWRRLVQIAVITIMVAGIALVVGRLRGRQKTASIRRIASSPAPTDPTIQPGLQRSTNELTFNPNDAVAFASQASAAVAELHDGITLEQWKNTQSNTEDWQPSKDESFFDCRTFVKTETLPSGRLIKHFVYFYPPEAPSPAVFPAASADELLNRDCKLSMLRVTTSASTDRDGHAFEQAIQEQFLPKYGDSIGMSGTRFQGATEGAHWNSGSEIISAYDPKPRPSGDDPSKPTIGEVFVFARLPIVHEIEQNSCCRIKDHYHSIEDSQFHQALTIAAADAAITDSVATHFQHLFRKIGDEAKEPSELDQSRSALLAVLRQWFDATQSLPPIRRAAALYVADRLLVAASDDGWPDLIDKEKTELRAALAKIGANFQYDELGGCYEYSGSWLDQAREVDPEGEVGQMAVLVSLARGGAPTLPKDKREKLDIFHTVISDGEWLLSKKPDPARAAQIHFIIGDADATIFALAGGAETEYGDPKEYQPEAPSARHNAMEHYRMGLAIDATSDNSKYAWLQAWKISAGLLPDTRWVYIYD